MHAKNSLRTMSNDNIKKVLLVVATLFLNQSVTLVYGLKHTKESRLNQNQKHLDKINKPPVLTIESPDGDLIDCVHKKQQPAFDHPLLVNHKIQKIPPKLPRAVGMERGNGNPIRQTWHVNGTRCPKGTIPIRRSTPQDVHRARSLSDFGGKPPGGRPELPMVNAKGHEYAYAYTNTSEYLHGAEATINLWNPVVQENDEFSASQIWVLAGSMDDSTLNSVQAGWQVSPGLYGDDKTRLFIYWTKDAYQLTGCYNLNCSGFIQKNDRVVLGGTVAPLSTFQGRQYEITIQILQDLNSGNWWMYLNNDAVGYWPAELFTLLNHHAEEVRWGGEIVNKRTDGKHTTTQMGSGQFAEKGPDRASYFRNLQVYGLKDNLNMPVQLETTAKTANCYDISAIDDDDNGESYFHYGGPGRNPNCP